MINHAQNLQSTVKENLEVEVTHNQKIKKHLDIHIEKNLIHLLLLTLFIILAKDLVVKFRQSRVI